MSQGWVQFFAVDQCFRLEVLFLITKLVLALARTINIRHSFKDSLLSLRSSYISTLLIRDTTKNTVPRMGIIKYRQTILRVSNS